MYCDIHYKNPIPVVLDEEKLLKIENKLFYFDDIAGQGGIVDVDVSHISDDIIVGKFWI